jgi:hypothetical protein
VEQALKKVKRQKRGATSTASAPTMVHAIFPSSLGETIHYKASLSVLQVSKTIKRSVMMSSSSSSSSSFDESKKERSSSRTTTTSPTSPLSSAAPRRTWSKLALQRRKILQEAQSQAEKLQSAARRKKRLQTISKSAKTVASKLNKNLNIGLWIDNLEKDQQLADQLEEMNADIQQEMERKALVQEVRQACMAAIQTHLESFLQENPQGLYEEWIAELHPDNVTDGNDHTTTVDARFYIQESDHRILWNQYHDHDLDSSVRSVPASPMLPPPRPQNVDSVILAESEEKLPSLPLQQQNQDEDVKIDVDETTSSGKRDE